MRRIELLIAESRRQTGNTEYSDDTGISDESFCQWATDAQNRLHSLILKVHSETFQKKSEVDIVSGTTEYDIPSDCFIAARVEKLEWSASGQARDYQLLMQRRDWNREADQVALCFEPSAGKLRFTYQKKLPRIEKRRGTVKSVTLDATARTLTALQFDTTVLLDAEKIAEAGYVTIVNKNGVVQMKAIPIASVNTSTGDVTLDGAFSYEAGEAIAAGNFAVLGDFGSSHPQLSEPCESYLIAYMNHRALHMDSSSDSLEENQGLMAMEEDIVSTYAEADFASDAVPIINDEFSDLSEG